MDVTVSHDMAWGETIGRHLYNFAHVEDGSRVRDLTPKWEDAGYATRELWRKLGRECLRQMEWAHHQGIESSWKAMEDPDSKSPPVSLAPLDWSPPECST